MKKNFAYLFIITFAGVTIFLSCKKEPSREGGSEWNKPPNAVAGPDRVITLPTDSVLLDGSSSSDPDGSITGYQWTKISGPASFAINRPSDSITVVKTLVTGIYQFELKVTDNNGLFSSDTIQVSVNTQLSPATCISVIRPVVNATLEQIAITPVPISGVASVGSKLLFTRNDYTSQIDIYDLVAHNWTSINLIYPRSGVTITSNGSKIFFAGGYYLDAGGNSHRSDLIQIYDYIAGTWSIATLSEPRSHMTTAVLGNKVFFAGGYPLSNKIDIYDLTANTWSIALLSEPKIDFTATTVNEKVYFAGGILSLTNNEITSSIIDIYDGQSDSWSVSSMSVQRADHAAIAIQNKIYWAGGFSFFSMWDGSESLCGVEIRDINNQSSTFSSLANPRPTDGARLNAGLRNNKIVFIQSANYYYNNEFDIYDLSTDSWSVGLLPYTLRRATIFSIDNDIYVVGDVFNGSNIDNIQVAKIWKLEF